MSKAGAPRHDPVPIGEVATPPFARLPDPLSLFHARAARFLSLARGHELAPYLRFLAALAETQHHIQGGSAEPELPESDALKACTVTILVPSTSQVKFVTVKF